MSPRWLRRAVIICLIALGFGCQAPRGPVSISSEDPDLKIQAIEQDVALKNTTDIPKMVQNLQSDDVAIRFYAIQALRRLTNDDFGYRFYEDDDQRAPATALWKKWLKRQKLGQ